MITRSTGAPTWIDLTTSDVGRTKDFYRAVFGWTYQDGGPEDCGYVVASTDGRVVAGIMQKDPAWDMPDVWTTYLRTDDIESTAAAAVTAGGTNCGGVMEIREKGRVSIVTDPSGGVVGLWQPAGHAGYEAFGEASAPVYHQLTTRDYAAALQFYREVFGWQTETVSNIDEFRYSTANFDGEALIGVMDGSAFLPAAAPSSWTCFFGVADVDQTIATIVEHGGSVVRAAEDTPYGRLAAVTDPTGALFNLSSLAPR